MDKTVAYNDLESWILSIQDLEVYNLTIDCKDVPGANFLGSETSASPFGEILKKSKNFFNITLTNFGVIDTINYMLSDCVKILSFDTSCFTNVINANYAFKGCANISSINMAPFTKLSSANGMFQNCKKIFEVTNISSLNITNAVNMFDGCESLITVDAACFANLSDASFLFRNCKRLNKIDASNFGNVTNATDMFSGCERLEKIDFSNSSKLINITNMFKGCIELSEIKWGVSCPEACANALLGITKSKDIYFGQKSTKDWFVSKASEIGAEKYNIIILLESLFSTMDISTLEADSYTLIIDCLNETNESLKNFSTKLKAAKPNVFINLKIINLGVDINNAESMFKDCVCLKKILSDNNNFASTSYMFQGCTNLTDVNMGLFKEDMNTSFMFQGCTSLNKIDLNIFTIITNSESMFQGCTNLSDINISALPLLENTKNMFQGCTSLTSIDTSNIPKSNNTESMFQDCTSLTNINLGETYAETKQNMFKNCSALTKIIVGSYRTYKWIVDNSVALGLDSLSINIVGDVYKIPNPINYEELSFWMNVFVPGSYDLNVKVTNAGIDDFKGTLTGPSLFGSILTNATEGVVFDLIFNIPDNITDASYCFNNYKTTNIPIKSIKITDSNLENTEGMFKNCDKIISIDTSIFKKTKNTNNMFEGCYRLDTIDVSDFLSVETSTRMFKDCSSLKTVFASNSLVFSKGANLLNSPIEFIYTNRNTKEYLEASDKVASKENITWFELKNKFTYSLVDSTKEFNLNINNKHISGDLTVKGNINGISDNSNITNSILSIKKDRISPDSFPTNITFATIISNPINVPESNSDAYIYQLSSENESYQIISFMKTGNSYVRYLTGDFWENWKKISYAEYEYSDGNLSITES